MTRTHACIGYALTLTAILAGGCDGTPAVVDDDDGGATVCAPGTSISCACADPPQTGVQVCNGDGSAFSPCAGCSDGAGGHGAATSGSGGDPHGSAAVTSGSGPSTVAGATGPSSSSGYTPGSGICNSGLSSGSQGEDACLTGSCCDSFNACVADTTCQACLTNNMAPGCSGNALLSAFDACAAANCNTNVCDSGITFTDGSGGPAFACIGCASDTGSHDCCTAATTCTGNGSVAAVDKCLTCLNDPAINSGAPSPPTSGACFNHGPTIYNAAVAFQQCLIDFCPAECGF